MAAKEQKDSFSSFMSNRFAKEDRNNPSPYTTSILSGADIISNSECNNALSDLKFAALSSARTTALTCFDELSNHQLTFDKKILMEILKIHAAPMLAKALDKAAPPQSAPPRTVIKEEDEEEKLSSSSPPPRSPPPHSNLTKQDFITPPPTRKIKTTPSKTEGHGGSKERVRVGEQMLFDRLKHAGVNPVKAQFKLFNFKETHISFDFFVTLFSPSLTLFEIFHQASGGQNRMSKSQFLELINRKRHFREILEDTFSVEGDLGDCFDEYDKNRDGYVHLREFMNLGSHKLVCFEDMLHSIHI